VDSQTLKDLSESPFGRSLHLLTHRLPRKCRAGNDWDLDRGFHLEVLGSDILQFTLRARAESEASTVPLLPGAEEAGQDRFLIWHCPGAYQPGRFGEFADQLRSRQTANIGLILSQTDERTQAMLDYPKYRGVWKGLEQPVVQVFQDFPNVEYFTAEKSLFALGRIGRRLLKLSKMRRLLPW
jgi:hypothetical protein